MTTFAFTVYLASPPHRLTHEVSDKLFEAGIDGHDNCGVGSRGGVVHVECELDAQTLADAIGSVLGRIEKAGYRMARIEMTEPLGVDEPARVGGAS